MPGSAPSVRATTAEPRPGAAWPQGLRVLVLSHLHPAVAPGGAGIAAWQMFRALQASPGVTAWFMAAAAGRLEAPLGSALFQPFGPDEFICADGSYDDFLHAGRHDGRAAALASLLAQLRPDVVHLHHYLNFGIEILLQIRRVLPQARIILTLHDYHAICHHDGQMVTRPDLVPCTEPGLRGCASCFPARHPNDFFLRGMYLRRFLDLVDQFIAPSRFLAARHIAWGLPAGRLHVIENGQPGPAPQPRPLPPLDHGLVFGFFGEVSVLKGAGLLAAAAELLAPAPASGPAPRLRIEIHGDSRNAPEAARQALAARLQAAGPMLELRGPCPHARVHQLMQDCHAILVPSLWWENSPMVIQEAFAAGRPVICADIGGMAEKVRDGVDGFHFRAGSPHALAGLLADLARDPGRLQAAAAAVTAPPALSETLAQLRAVYALPGRAAGDPPASGGRDAP